MNRFIILIVCCLMSASLVRADEPATPKSNVATATVWGDRCVFLIPIDDIDRQWKWGVSLANQCEYSWMVNVKRRATSYQLGFSYFNPIAIPQSGTFADLLIAGQTNVWCLEPDGKGASYVEGVEVMCDVFGKRLRITVDDETWTKELFGDTPETIQFETNGTQLKKGKVDVRVDYKPVRVKSSR